MSFEDRVLRFEDHLRTLWSSKVPKSFRHALLTTAILRGGTMASVHVVFPAIE
jgi:hypothetical protein